MTNYVKARHYNKTTNPKHHSIPIVDFLNEDDDGEFEKKLYEIKEQVHVFETKLEQASDEFV